MKGKTRPRGSSRDSAGSRGLRMHPLDETKVETLEKTLREVAPSRRGAKRDEKKCARAGDEDRYEEEITLVSELHRTPISNKIDQYGQQRRTFVEAACRRVPPVDQSVGRFGRCRLLKWCLLSMHHRCCIDYRVGVAMAATAGSD